MSPRRKVAQALHELGWLNGTLYLCARALQLATRGRARLIKYAFVAQPVPQDSFSGTAMPESIVVTRAAPDDPIVAQFPRPQEVITRRFNDGAICFVAVVADELAGFIWIKPHQYMEDEVRCLYVLAPPGLSAWDFDVWVAPRFRLTRTFARLWDAANVFLQQCGYRWSLSRISAFNSASLRSHARLGAVNVGSGLFLLIGRVQLALFTCPPFVHTSLYEARYPTLHLRAPDAALAERTPGTISDRPPR